MEYTIIFIDVLTITSAFSSLPSSCVLKICKLYIKTLGQNVINFGRNTLVLVQLNLSILCNMIIIVRLGIKELKKLKVKLIFTF